jgi:UDP-N-acetylmuramate--alanine ligase
MTEPVDNPAPRIEVTKPMRCHVVGVCGPGMSAVAILLARMGHTVSGSDMNDSAVVGTLESSGVRVHIGHDASLVRDADVVVYSTAIPQTNVELLESRAFGVPTVHRSAMLAAITAAHRSVGVAGTHGKTTTTSLLTVMLRADGRDPSYYIGADVFELGGAGLGVDGTMVIEADESDGTAQAMSLSSMILTNVDADHLDHFGTVERIEDEFVAMAQRLDGPFVVCGDDERAARVARRAGCHRTVTYGFGAHNDVVVSGVQPTAGGITFAVGIRGATITVDLPLRGDHNALNCAAAIAMAVELGVEPNVAARSVSGFRGVDRRFIEHGSHRGALLIDDYAHLPAEIAAVLAAVRTHPSCTGRVIAVFQPNRFHRIATMAGEYAGCFAAADEVFVTDIYASGTAPIEGVTGMLVVDAVRTRHGAVTWAETRGELVAAVDKVLAPGDVCISMGCGDISGFPAQLKASSR